MSDERIELIKRDLESDNILRMTSVTWGDVRYLLDCIDALENVRNAAIDWRASLAMDDFGDLYNGQAEIEALCDAIDALAALEPDHVGGT